MCCIKKVYDCFIVLVSAYFYLSISYHDLFKGNLFEVTKDLATIVRVEVFGMIYICIYLHIYYSLIKQGKVKEGIFLSIVMFVALLIISNIVYIVFTRLNIHITYNDFILRMVLNTLFFILLTLRYRCKDV